MEYDFICPKCSSPLTLKGKSYVCENGHCYDVAKSGYVNLVLANQKNSAEAGDNKEMIEARQVVMEGNYYQQLADDIIAYLNNYDLESLVDAGCGIGYIPYRLTEAFPKAKILGADISKEAILSASKKYKNIPFAVASSIRLPIKSSSIDALICAFAPVFPQEFNRVLRDNGLFLRIIPDKKHLFRLKELLYETPYENELDPIEISGFKHIETIISRKEIVASGSFLHSIIKMTPYYYHTRKSDIENLLKLGETAVNLEFAIRIYKKLP